MAPVIGDIIQIVANQSYGGQLMQNIHFYRLDSIPAQDDYPDMYEYFGQRFNVIVGIPMRALQVSDVEHTFYSVKNVTNGIDFFDVAINADGLLGAPLAASFLALNFILRRSNGLTRNGSKRLGGLSENASEGNDITASPALIAALEAAYSAPLSTSDAIPVDFATPVIVGRTNVSLDPDEPEYELDLDKINPIASSSVTAISTQRTRKLGAGL